MQTSERKAGDQLARELIADYFRTLSGTGFTWNLHASSLHFTPRDRWANREKWIAVARQCLERGDRILFALEILLAEGFDEYLPRAAEVVACWHRETGGHDPEYYYDLLARLPADNRLRRRYLSDHAPANLDRTGRAALVAVRDPVMCRWLADRVEQVFRSSPPDEEDAEEIGLPSLLELGRLGGEYVSPQAMQAVREFCLVQLAKDREVAPYHGRLAEDLAAGRIDRRILWIRDEIAHVAWQIGWFDLLAVLRHEPWYWNGLFDTWYADRDNHDLLVWSQYARDEQLLRRAMKVMRSHPYHKLDGAIAWLRMTAPIWPPQ